MLAIEASLVIAALMVRFGPGARLGPRVLEAAPVGLDPQDTGRAIAAGAGVGDVSDLRVWEVTTGFPALAAHVLVKPGQDCHAVRRDLERLLHERFEIEHTTLQVDHARPSRLLTVGGDQPRPT